MRKNFIYLSSILFVASGIIGVFLINGSLFYFLYKHLAQYAIPTLPDLNWGQGVCLYLFIKLFFSPRVSNKTSILSPTPSKNDNIPLVRNRKDNNIK